MSFDLRIRFEGLMMWVPEGEKAMHVLIPAITGHDHGKKKDGQEKEHQHPKKDPKGKGDDQKIPEHVVRVVVDQAYLKPDQKQLTRNLFMVDLAGRVLDLTGLSWDGMEASLPNEIPSLDGAVEPLHPDIVKGKPVAPVAARVTMDAGAMTNYELGIPFTFLDEARRITGVTEWTIRGVGTRQSAAEGGAFCLRGTQILAHEDDKTDLPDLFPIGHAINLTVMHLVRGDFPPHGPRFNPEVEDPDFHFDAYFDVAKPKRRKPEPPEPTKVPDIEVDGDPVDDDGDHIPGSICGTVRVSLA